MHVLIENSNIIGIDSLIVLLFPSEIHTFVIVFSLTTTVDRCISVNEMSLKALTSVFWVIGWKVNLHND